MKLALENKLWTAAGREAVFVCINMSDALLAKHNGLRNISKDHMDVVKVVATVLPMSDRKNQSNRLRKVIQMKNLIDYESREFSEKSANDIALQATRFYEWGESVFMKIGYARVSTADQNLESQIDALKKAGCDEFYKEKKSGVSEREELEKALGYLREGDTLVVTKLDRLGRSLKVIGTNRRVQRERYPFSKFR